MKATILILLALIILTLSFIGIFDFNLLIEIWVKTLIVILIIGTLLAAARLIFTHK